MAIISPATVKKCVSCEYWGGAKAASPTGREVKYKLNMTGGDTGYRQLWATGTRPKREDSSEAEIPAAPDGKNGAG